MCPLKCCDGWTNDGADGWVSDDLDPITLSQPSKYQPWQLEPRMMKLEDCGTEEGTQRKVKRWYQHEAACANPSSEEAPVNVVLDPVPSPFSPHGDHVVCPVCNVIVPDKTKSKAIKFETETSTSLISGKIGLVTATRRRPIRGGFAFFIKSRDKSNV